MGFDVRDFGDTRRPRPRRHRRFPLPDEPPTVKRVFTQRLAPVSSTEPEVVDRARSHLADQCQTFAEAHGYEVLEGTWSTWADDRSGPGATAVELVAELRPRMDGEWPSIRAALAEDERDREEAADTADDIDDRLDALRESVGVWTATTPMEVREALGLPSAPARHPAEGDRPPSPITRDVRDRDYTP